MRIYAYLRASTKTQDASRAKNAITNFCAANDMVVSAWFFETESGATLKRPELFRLLETADNGDVLLVEQVDRISRLNAKDWEKLKGLMAEKGLRIVSLDLPTSHNLIKAGDEFTEWMLRSFNSMMLDMLAAIARKDYDDRQRRQKEGIERARADGKYPGRKRNEDRRETISALLKANKSYSEIVRLAKCSRATIASVKKEMKK